MGTGPGLLDKWRLIGEIMRTPGMAPADALVAYQLLDHYNVRSGLCFPSYETIAKRSGLQVRSVKRSVARLVEDGWFTKVARGGRGLSNRYMPSFERVTNQSPFKTRETVTNESPFKADKRCPITPGNGDQPRPKTVTNESPELKKEKQERETGRERKQEPTLQSRVAPKVFSYGYEDSDGHDDRHESADEIIRQLQVLSTFMNDHGRGGINHDDRLTFEAAQQYCKRYAERDDLNEALRTLATKLARQAETLLAVG